jgi:DNase/tRNase domain of colicin-like bacteriocin
LYGKGGVGGEIEILMSGKNSEDFSAARQAMRDKLNNQSWAQSSKDPYTPDGYTWHHKKDGAAMQLVEQTVHDKEISGAARTSGASIVLGAKTQF